MNRLKNNQWLLIVIMLFLCSTHVYSYPPDNAAVLYYKAAMLYEVDDEMKETLEHFQKGKIESDEKIREFIKQNYSVIRILLDATKIKNCDWAMDVSQGMSMTLPPLSSLRELARLVIAEAKVLTEDGDYETAINRCMTLYKMARHINDRIYINYLVGMTINDFTHECMMKIMAEMPQNMQRMTQLKNHLKEINDIPFHVKPAISGERENILATMTLKQIPEIIRLSDVDESTKKKLRSLDEVAIHQNRKYYKKHVIDIMNAFDMPYTEGYTSIKKRHQKIKEDVKRNPNLFLTELLEPAVDKIFSISTRFKTDRNAIKAAVELYLIKAQTGKLPDKLPSGLPKDLFSNKKFKYEKTADGFLLRCQGKDLSKDKVYEYNFKVK